MDSNFEKKPKSYYVDFSKRRGNRWSNKDQKSGEGSRYKATPNLDFGARGFLITSFDEVKCYLEMRQILEEYFDILYSKSEIQSDNDKIETKTTEDDIESELKSLRVKRPFKQVKTSCRNSLFINITEPFRYVDPVKIVNRFFDDLAESKEQRTSYTFKLLPVIDTFRPSKSCAQTCITELLKNQFTDQSESKYFIEFQSRGNYKLNPDDKKEMIEAVADSINEQRPQWKVSRESADLMIIIIAFKQVCCLSIVSDYFRRRKYNIVEFCKPADQGDEASKDIEEKKHDDQSNEPNIDNE